MSESQEEAMKKRAEAYCIQRIEEARTELGLKEYREELLVDPITIGGPIMIDFLCGFAKDEAALSRSGEGMELAEYKLDKERLVRVLDVIWNGEAGAAKQASLCDIVAQVSRELPSLRKLESRSAPSGQLKNEVMQIAHEIFDDAIQISYAVGVPDEYSEIAYTISQLASGLMVIAEAIGRVKAEPPTSSAPERQPTREQCLEQAIREFQETRGKHDGPHSFPFKSCCHCDAAYVKAEEKLDAVLKSESSSAQETKQA